MKTPPKKFKYPRLYAVDIGEKIYSYRLRIVYPDGKVEFSYQEFLESDNPPELGFRRSCWAYTREGGFSKLKKLYSSGNDALKAMHKFDKEQGYKSFFIGEIK